METATQKKKSFMDTLDKLAENPKLRDRLYLIGFAVTVVTSLLQNSMIRDTLSLIFYVQNIAAMVIAVKMLIFDRKSIPVWLISLPVIILSRLLWIRFNYFYAFSIAVCVVGASGVRFEKIAKTFFYAALSTLTVVFILSQTGIIKDLCYESDHPFGSLHIRHSFGIVYTTDFAAYVFFILLSFYAAYQKFDRFFYLRALVPFIVAPVVYCFCITRLDCLCMLLLGVGMIAVGLFHRFKDKVSGFAAVLRKLFEQLCIWSMPILAVFINVLTLAYTPDSPLLVKLNSLLNTRLAMGRQGFDKYPVTLFGQLIFMHGMGATTNHNFAADPYFFLDSSYIFCLLILGLVYTLMLITAFVFTGLRYRHNHVILLCSAMIAINCTIAHHLPDISYNFLVTALLAEGGISLHALFKRKKTGNEPQPVEETAPDSGQ